MAKKRKKLKKKTKKLITVLVVVLVTLVLLCVGVISIYNYIEKRVEERNAEQARIAEENRLLAEQRAHPLLYTEFVEKYAEEYGVPISIVYSIIKVESAYDPDAVSYAGAKGLMQITDITFDYIRGKLGESTSDSQVFDPETNIRYGVWYLSDLYNRYSAEGYEDWNIVFAAYNAGPTTVWNWLADDSVTVNKSLENIPYGETSDYLYKVNTAREKYIELYDLGE